MKNLSKSEIIAKIKVHVQQLEKLEKELEQKETTIEVSAHKFEVYHEDCKFKLNHDEAAEYCKNLDVGWDAQKGGGWRLPTRREQIVMYDCKEKLSLENAIYWSSTEYNATSAFSFNFNYGNANANLKTNTFSVRAVRTI